MKNSISDMFSEELYKRKNIILGTMQLLENKFSLPYDEMESAIQQKDNRLIPAKRNKYNGNSPTGGIYVVEESNGPSFFSVEFNIYENITLEEGKQEIGNFVAITAVPIKLEYDEENKTLKENIYENYFLDKSYIYVAILPVTENQDAQQFAYELRNCPMVEGLELEYKGYNFQDVFNLYFS